MPVFRDLKGGDRGSHSLRIGLINNMQDEALRATERQFIALLNAASDGLQIQLSLYSLPGVSRNEASVHHMTGLYRNIEEIGDSHLDGLIVTGREPLAANLRDEPYWESFVKILEWAQENTHATVWSCSAAHAAILHLDGIVRSKRCDKLFGVFACERVLQHPLTTGTPPWINIPHSRWNGIPEEQLSDSGYEVLTRGREAGVDAFVKQQKSLFVFFQGHPEYESDTLLREYRRDLGRYFTGQTENYPSLPKNYFDHNTIAALQDLRQRATPRRSKELLRLISDLLANKNIENTWQSSAAGFYRNWLGYLCAQRERGVARVTPSRSGTSTQWIGNVP